MAAVTTSEDATGYAPDTAISAEEVEDHVLAESWQPVPRRSFLQEVGDWFRSRTAEQWAYFAIFALAAFLRLWDLGAKPLHHDESLHAYYSWQFLLNPSGYQYNPLLHGPFQFHIIPLFFVLGHLFGLSDNGVNDFTVRLLPALMGLAMVAMPYGLRRQLGHWGALAMALLLAVSPTFVYYSRFVRDDIYVTCFTLLIVVAAVQYSQTHRLAWLLTAVAALILSYTAMENTFFIIAIFGSFLVGLLLWDLGPAVGAQMRAFAVRDRPLAGRVFLLAPAILLLSIIALVGLHWMNQLSATINTLAAKYANDPQNPLNPDVAVNAYQEKAVTILLLVSVLISLAATIGLMVRLFREPGVARVPRWHSWVDPQRQPVLDTILSTDWVRWFIGFVVAWVIFAAFFVELPHSIFNFGEWGSGFQDGLGRGLIRGIYYWLEQQQVQRGGQPWYYYLVLIPLYEQLALVFGIAGIVRSLVQPNRFRIFLVFWFATTLLLYSWAGEKMPWLVIHIMLPLIALAGVALDWVLQTVVRGARGWWKPTRVLVAAGVLCLVGGVASLSVASTMFFALLLSALAIVAIGVAVGLEQWSRRRAAKLATARDLAHLVPAPRWTVAVQQNIAFGSLALALVLLVPTVWNMQRVTFYEPSVAPNEMLVYVQTTTDVQTVMAKIDYLDKMLYGGQHKLKIGVTSAEVWPYAWYLRDYPGIFNANGVWQSGAFFNYSSSAGGPMPDVILADVADANITTTPGQFDSHQYHLRWWWDEGYKLPQCSTAKPTQCLTNPPLGTGVGPLLWLSYGDTPPTPCADPTKPQCDPANAQPNGALAAQRYWNWLWHRQNISGTSPESTDFIFYVRMDITHYTHA
jgi:uncharacterized protein (TIGR03663 family)